LKVAPISSCSSLLSIAAGTRDLAPRLSSPAWTATASSPRRFSTPVLDDKLSEDAKVLAPPLVYVSGEEMTRYACQLMLESWINPFFDTSRWEYYDLSCAARDKSDDRVLKDAVQAGKRIGAIFKEPTITPSASQVKEFGLSKALSSPNGAMRRGWNGITISRDTIHIEGIELGYKRPVYFERHAVGGEYGAGWASVGKGTLLTTYLPSSGTDPPFVVDKRDLTDDHNVVVCYSNPYDNVVELAHLFFSRCLDAGLTPYVVTKKTVFKWQEGFWTTMKSVFDEHYKAKFLEKNLLDRSGGDLSHLISDAATMQLIRWTDGGFGMAAHNYDGDMRT
jgi:isocitrate dehydrogenase